MEAEENGEDEMQEEEGEDEMQEDGEEEDEDRREA